MIAEERHQLLANTGINRRTTANTAHGSTRYIGRALHQLLFPPSVIG
jgi:hypothetical protein